MKLKVRKDEVKDTEPEIKFWLEEAEDGSITLVCSSGDDIQWLAGRIEFYQGSVHFWASKNCPPLPDDQLKLIS